MQLPWIVLGVLLIAGCSLAFGVMAQELGARSAVVALARPLAQGVVVTPADLTSAEVAADPDVPLVAADDAARLVGRMTRAPLPAGTLASPALFGPPGVEVSAAHRVVGMALDTGEYPIATVGPGDTVSVVRTAGTGAVLADGVVVVESAPDETTGQLFVSLAIGTADATAVAAAAAHGDVRLLLHGDDL